MATPPTSWTVSDGQMTAFSSLTGIIYNISIHSEVLIHGLVRRRAVRSPLELRFAPSCALAAFH